MRILFIMNPIAGGGKDLKRISRIIASVLQRERDCNFDLKITSKRGEATEIAEKAVHQNYDVVVAVGGDGTVNEVASGLVNSNIPLGIVPVGSGNGIARGLGLPLTLRRSIKTVCCGETHQFDVGVIQKRYFLATTGLGFDAVVGKLFDEGSSRGPLPYFYIGVKEFFHYKPKEYILEFNNTQKRVKALIVAVANTNQFGNGALIAPYAKPDDGLLDLAIIRDINAFRAIMELPRLFTGQLPRSEYYEFYQTSEVRIIRPEPAPIHVDGEPFNGADTVTVRIMPKAISVIVPVKSTENNHVREYFREIMRMNSKQGQRA